MIDILSSSLVLTLRKGLYDAGVAPGSKVLACVSGGVDSMVLLAALSAMKYSVAVAHVNFQLRGEESVGDEMLVKDWCEQHQIPLFLYHANTKEYAAEKRMNIQSAARKIRYEWWDELVFKHSFDFVATAHHRDDNIETFFINLFRGSGLKGLKGIPLRRDYFIRPLLLVSRTEIEIFANDYNIPFRNDSSNENDDYLRNRIRHHLIPVLKEFSPDSDSLMKQSFLRLNLEWQSWEHAYQHWVINNIEQTDEEYNLKAGKHESAFILKWLEEKGFPWSLAFDYVQADDAPKGNILAYGEHRLSRTHEGFFLGKNNSFDPVVIDSPGHYAVNEGRLIIQPVSRDDVEMNDDPMIEYINAERLRWPLEIREVRHGDHFKPLGMNGQTKKIQDHLVDLKLDAHTKAHVRILSSQDHIIWVIGLRLDERVKVHSDTKSLMRLSYVPGRM